MVETISPDKWLNLWLDKWGLIQNPFDSRNAEQEPDLSKYFVDTGIFDDLYHRVTPGVVFASRGCGKTAHRQLLASYCRPFEENSHLLAVVYSYNAFEWAKAETNGVATQDKIRPYVNALVHYGMIALEGEAERDPKIKDKLRDPANSSELIAYLARFVPTMVRDTDIGSAHILGSRTTLELLQGFADLVRTAGMSACVVLVDGVDEILSVPGDPERMAALIAPLLGNLPLLECPGVVFRFFLPQEMEVALRTCSWYRPDRLQIFLIRWQEGVLKEMIGQRLTYYSQRADIAYTRLGQLCQEGLAGVIDDELAKLANGQPRAALILADMLLHTHCDQPNPPLLITSQTWEGVKEKWKLLQADILKENLPATIQGQSALKEQLLQAPSSAAPLKTPLLHVDEAKQRVWLGEKEIELTGKLLKVLLCLYRNQNAVVDRDSLARDAWAEDDPKGVSDAAIAATISRLRERLGQTAPNKGYIETRTGVGYLLHPEGFDL